MQHITSFIESQQQLHNPILIKSDLPTQVSISPLVSTSSLPSIISNLDYETHINQVQMAHQQQPGPQQRAKFPMK